MTHRRGGEAATGKGRWQDRGGEACPETSTRGGDTEEEGQESGSGWRDEG